MLIHFALVESLMADDSGPQTESNSGLELPPVPLEEGPLGTPEEELLSLIEERERAIVKSRIDEDIYSASKYKEEKGELLVLLGHQHLLFNKFDDATNELKESIDLHKEVSTNLEEMKREADSASLISDIEERIEGIEEFINIIQGLYLISSAKLNFSHGRPNIAKEKFREAKSFAEDEQELKIFKSYEYMSEGMQNIKVNNYKEARNSFAKAKQGFQNLIEEHDDNSLSEDQPINSEMVDKGLEMDYNLTRYYEAISSAKSYYQDSNYEFAKDEFERCKDIASNVDLLSDIEPPESEAINGINESYDSVWSSLRHLASAQQLKTEGMILKNNNEFSQAINKYKESKNYYHENAEEILNSELPQSFWHYQRAENNAREMIPKLIEACREERELYNEKEKIREEKVELQNRLVDIANQGDINVGNSMEASLVAESSVEIVQEIKPHILNNAEELLSELPSSNLPQNRREELHQLSHDVIESEEEQSWLEKVKSLGQTSKDVLENNSEALSSGSSIVSLLKFFSMFV